MTSAHARTDGSRARVGYFADVEQLPKVLWFEERNDRRSALALQSLRQLLYRARGVLQERSGVKLLRRLSKPVAGRVVHVLQQPRPVVVGAAQPIGQQQRTGSQSLGPDKVSHFWVLLLLDELLDHVAGDPPAFPPAFSLPAVLPGG